MASPSGHPSEGDATVGKFASLDHKPILPERERDTDRHTYKERERDRQTREREREREHKHQQNNKNKNEVLHINSNGT